MEKIYCAFLRGVNVNGTNMKMADVVSAFETAGMSKVCAVLASGNIIFTSDKNEEELRSILEEAMSKRFVYNAFLFIKSQSELKNMIAYNTFSDHEDFHTYIFITENGFEETLLDEFNKCEKTSGEEAQIQQSFFYWKIKKGFTVSGDFSKILGKKQFKDKLTSRNINTLHKIIKKMIQ